MCAHFSRFSLAIRLASLIARATTGYPLGVTAPHAPTQSELMQALESTMGFGRRRSPAGSPHGIMTPLEALLLDAQKERHEANQLMGPRSPYEGPFATARSPPLPLLANDLYPHGCAPPPPAGFSAADIAAMHPPIGMPPIRMGQLPGEPCCSHHTTIIMWSPLAHDLATSRIIQWGEFVLKAQNQQRVWTPHRRSLALHIAIQQQL